MSDTTPRDRLGLTISAYRRNAEVAWDDDLRLADHLLNLGWRPPARVVTTVEELDALPVGSIVRDVERAALDEKWDDNMWAEVAYEYTFSSRSIHLPALVLYEPEEGE